jgi:hypothetical protein
VSLIAGLGQFVVPFFAGIAAIVCGHAARRSIRRANGATTGNGLAVAGLILGYVGTILLVLAVATGATVVAVFHDDWARSDARRGALRLAHQIELASAQTGTSPRDAGTIARAWAEFQQGSGNVDVAVADGQDVLDATNDDWTRVGWRLEYTVHDLSTAHACLTIPATRGDPPVVTAGSCNVFPTD